MPHLRGYLSSENIGTASTESTFAMAVSLKIDYWADQMEGISRGFQQENLTKSLSK